MEKAQDHLDWWALVLAISVLVYGNHIDQNSVTLTCIEPDIEYSRLSDGTYTDLITYGQFFVTADILWLYN
jgi:hypothetical protein